MNYLYQKNKDWSNVLNQTWIVGDLLDVVYENENCWREAIILYINISKPNLLFIKILFCDHFNSDQLDTEDFKFKIQKESMNDHKIENNEHLSNISLSFRWVNAGDPSQVQPYGRRCLTEISPNDENIPYIGCLVDFFVETSSKEKIISSGKISKYLPNNFIEIMAIDKSNYNQIVSREALRPFGSITVSFNHKDNISRRAFLSLLRLKKRNDCQKHSKKNCISNYNEHKSDESLEKSMNTLIECENFSYNPNSLDIETISINNKIKIIKMLGDGNCLFRAISHQIYGKSIYHLEVRNFTMDYMSINSDDFVPFLIGGSSVFSTYIDFKRRDGAWGDHLELHAMCELYGRFAEIYSFDSNHKLKKLRTIHEDCLQGPPILLFYEGSKHYDSIINIFSETLYLETPGILEKQKISESIERNFKKKKIASSHPTENKFSDASLHKVNTYNNSLTSTNFDDVLEYSLKEAKNYESDSIQKVLEESMLYLNLIPNSQNKDASITSNQLGTEIEDIQRVLFMSQSNQQSESITNKEKQSTSKSSDRDALISERKLQETNFNEHSVSLPVDYNYSGSSIEQLLDDDGYAIQRAIEESYKSC